MTEFNQKYWLHGIAALAILGIILISGCVEKLIEKPINDTEMVEEPEAPITDIRTGQEPVEKPQKEVTALEENEKIINDVGYKAKRVENTSISGKFNENQIWSGEILITANPHIE